jgi:hypothetical protein
MAFLVPETPPLSSELRSEVPATVQSVGSPSFLLVVLFRILTWKLLFFPKFKKPLPVLTVYSIFAVWIAKLRMTLKMII